MSAPVSRNHKTRTYTIQLRSGGLLVEAKTLETAQSDVAKSHPGLRELIAGHAFVIRLKGGRVEFDQMSPQLALQSLSKVFPGIERLIEAVGDDSQGALTPVRGKCSCGRWILENGDDRAIEPGPGGKIQCGECRPVASYGPRRLTSKPEVSSIRTVAPRKAKPKRSKA